VLSHGVVASRAVVVHHLFQIASLVAPAIADRLAVHFPRFDRFAVQTFAPDDGLVATAPPQGGPEAGLPVTRAVNRAQTADGLLQSGVWEAGSGTQTFRFDFDEWVHILEGEAHVTAAGETRTLRAGDVALFRAHLEMTWEIPEYVRKVWVHRHRARPLSRIARRGSRLARRVGRPGVPA
jgi:uncharacterized cupin superfamily protein